jgi:hypothetical protein
VDFGDYGFAGFEEGLVLRANCFLKVGQGKILRRLLHSHGRSQRLQVQGTRRNSNFMHRLGKVVLGPQKWRSEIVV